MIVIIDNYDSFTYNLYQAVAKLYPEVKVFRHDAISVTELNELAPKAIVLSPGPKGPQDAGICLEVVKELAPTIPILGVCLGHQVIAEAFGGEVKVCHQTVHGKPTSVFHRRRGLFHNLSLPFQAGRYHSLIVDKLPEELEVEAESPEGLVMGVKHKRYPCYGVQFHPESILTPEGELLIQNFLKLIG